MTADTPGAERALPLAAGPARAAAVVGAALGVAGDAYHLFVLDDRPTQAATLGYRLHGFALMLGLILLVLAAPGLAVGVSRLLRAALPMLTLGTALVVGDIWAETVVSPGVVGDSTALLAADIGGFHLAAVIAAYLLFAVGWLLYAVDGLRRRWCPRPTALVLAVGAVLAFLPIGGSYVLLSVGMGMVGLAARGQLADRGAADRSVVAD